MSTATRAILNSSPSRDLNSQKNTLDKKMVDSKLAEVVAILDLLFTLDALRGLDGLCDSTLSTALDRALKLLCEVQELVSGEKEASHGA